MILVTCFDTGVLSIDYTQILVLEVVDVKPAGKFGIDDPWVPWMWIGIAVLTAGVAVGFSVWDAGWWTWLLAWYFGICAVINLIGAGLYWNASLRGKFVIWYDVLRRTQLRSGAQALDLGCGRGAVSIMIASQYPKADVTGIDLWRTVDQSGNSPETAMHNARVNGVEHRVTFETGDMTDLPYADSRFDLVVASLSIHNIPTAEGRSTALQEAVRVLAPGGQIIIIDIQRGREYADELRILGLRVDGPKRLGWRSWWTGPWMAASLICARNETSA
ncbi:MAG: methyltransferase domain-containing protein [Micropruina sp.]